MVTLALQLHLHSVKNGPVLCDAMAEAVIPDSTTFPWDASDPDEDTKVCVASKRECEEVATPPSQRMGSNIPGCVTHLIGGFTDSAFLSFLPR
jgi:hypothetical protein